MLGSPDHRPLNCVLFCVLFSRFLNVNQPLQVGGVKETHPHRRTHPHYKGFVGCVKNLVVDSQVQTILFLSFFSTACTHTPGVPGILFSTLAWAVANALMGVHNVEPLLNELGTLQSV